MTEILTLKRGEPHKDGTFGVIYRDGRLLCVTCEDRWIENKPMISCIPVGNYLCEPYTSGKFPNVWEVTGVPGRSKILIHSGNTSDDTHGCILVGNSYGTVNDKRAVINSRFTMDMLRRSLPGRFALKIE